MSAEHSVQIKALTPSNYLNVINRGEQLYGAAKAAAKLTHCFYAHNSGQPGEIRITGEDGQVTVIALDRRYMQVVNNFAFQRWMDLVHPRVSVNGEERRVFDPRGKEMADLVMNVVRAELDDEFNLILNPPARPEHGVFCPEYWNPEHGSQGKREDSRI